MTFARFHGDAIRLRNDRISEEDGLRQEQAAAELLRRLDRQPGVVLADEVGMGKTFVALATAVSVLIDRENEGPVVVMCPPSLKEKWPKDWNVFREKCLLDPALRSRLRADSADSGIEFLRLLDDPEEERNHIIFLTHGALNRTVGDGWAKLAVIKRAFRGRSSLSTQREAFPRFAGKLLWLDYIDRRSPGLLGSLVDRPYEDWLRVIHRADPRLKDEIRDDPVPTHLAEALEAMTSDELDQVVEGLYQLPVRESDNIDVRLTQARQGIANAMEQVWKLALRRASFRSPLLILDEAHHVKNPATKLASLFATEESAKDSKYFDSAGPLGGKFHRMLFLTATPFQLGHVELIRVLERFEGISWHGKHAPSLGMQDYKAELVQIGRALDDAQASALRLDRSWSKLDAEHLLNENGHPLEADTWWEHVRDAQGEGVVAQIVAQVARTKAAMAAAEQSLTPWVLRHVKPRHLPGAGNVDRRDVRPGAAILDGSPSNGIDISGAVLLPFLLAGRAQALLAASTKGRAFFAEGLSSSFEAYLETRSDQDGLDEDADTARMEAPPELDWYLKHLDRALPRNDNDVRSAHPKVHATAQRAVSLWEAGEKVLVFCHYRATGRALRQHISSLLEQEIMRIARGKLARATDVQITRTLTTLGDRFGDDSRLGRVVRDWVTKIAGQFPELHPRQDTVVSVVQRFIRTPSFLVRYFPLDTKDAAGAFAAAVDSATSDSQSLRLQVEHFCRFLAERCIESERHDFLDALDKVQTGSHVGADVQQVFDPRETSTSDRRNGAVLLPNVRLANGEVRQETRMRLLRTFNTPLFPEILIASSVMAEGVDLHLNCRQVIHHDLCWNPSTLEQRSGRVDRIGCKAEREGKSIHLYMPYVAATQDEKMYRVVRDRERWFQVIMGEKYEVDEASTDRQASRMLLPTQVAQQLTMKLHP